MYKQRLMDFVSDKISLFGLGQELFEGAVSRPNYGTSSKSISPISRPFTIIESLCLPR